MGENAIPDTLTWTDSASSNVHSYAHDPETSRLYVRFRSGGAGYYDNVSGDVHNEFAGAESHGKFVHARLRNNDDHPWTRLDQE